MSNTDENKVLKSDELLGGGGDFLSGLGFGQEKEEKHIKASVHDIDDTEGSEKQKDTSDSTVDTTSEKKKEEKKDDFPFASKKRVIKKNYVPKRAHGKRPRRGDTGHRHRKAVPTPSRAIPTPSGFKKKAATSANLKKKLEITIQDGITVKEFAEKMGVELPNLMKVMMKNKILMGITSSLDFDTATLLGAELGVEVKRPDNTQLDMESFLAGDLQAILDMDKDAKYLQARAPIVTVMGHVDHGKTTLLDYLRKTNIAEGEAGGITQGIGSSVVDYNGQKITFIDTPGHELFTTLRSRGAKLTNIVVIVVAADDSVMPQTIESINHAKAAGVPIIIAITKIDKPGKEIEQIKADLSQHDITPEDWGGDSPVIGVSGITGEGIDDLLEQILLHTEMLELKYNPQRSAVGVVLDAYKDPKQGVISNVIVMTGTLKIGDIVVAHNTYGKVRRMQDWKGNVVKSATGGDPVQILGITELPDAGRVLEVVSSEKEATKKIAEIKEHSQNTESSAIQDFLSKLGSDDGEISELRLIIKSDGSSSLDALQSAVRGIDLPENVAIKIVHSSVGHFSDSDLSLAQASSSLLLGFNISMNSSFKKKAEFNNVQVKNFDIIYELTEYLEQIVKGMIKIEEEEVVIGKMEVLAIFYSKFKDMVLGGKVIEGKIKNKTKFRIIRGEEILSEGAIQSLQKNKDEIKEAKEGEECGIKVKTGKKIQEGDILEFYEMQVIE